MIKNKGQKLWKKAKKIILGGNMLLSKNPDQFLPKEWPSYYKKAKGCEIWDLENNKYKDICLMGVGTNILGYSFKEVDKKVQTAMKSGNMSTLNCPEEVELAEKLIEMHPWFDMVKFARTGGEANALAIRIARAASGKDKVAFCGYHGWHDWYLAANLKNEDNLQEHLLPGLNALGVPKNLGSSVYPFKFNDYEALENIIKNHDIGAIKMEVSRSKEPDKEFLKKVRKLADRENIILIFDECTSGFRESFGGLHKKYKVNPDMAIFGKALGNGYAITSVIGKREVMESAASSFISSTFWTERIGPTAALKTLEVMEREKSWEYISSLGKNIKKNWNLISENYDLDINIEGLSALPGFTFSSKNNLAYKTLITQEMLKKGFLASNVVYVSTSHNEKILDSYFSALDEVFSLIKKCEMGEDINKYLKVPICNSGFGRLN